MSHANVSHLLKIAVGGGEDHKLAIAELAVLLADAGHKVHDTTIYSDSPYRPDLISSKQDRFIDGAHRKMITMVYWWEIFDTSDPPRDFVKVPGQLMKIDISKCANADERIKKLKQAIP